MKFRLRSFISLLLGPAFLLVTISGLLLYAGPSGRYASWSDWTFWGVSRKAWCNLHITISILLIIVALLHWVLNWRVFWRYIKVKAGESKLRLELIAALLVFVIAIAGTLLEVPPFSSTLNLGDTIKESLNEGMPKPPLSENTKTESLPLSELAEELEIPVDEMIATLEKAGFEVKDSSTTILDIAKKSDVAPIEVFTPIMKAFPDLNID